MKTIILTRFSILDVKSNSWILTRDNNGFELKQKLFDEKRLEIKFWAFDNITYPSIKNQTNQNFIWLIYTSNQLPKEWKDRLYSYECDNIKIIEIENMSRFGIIDEYITEDYCTVRLDDDDGLDNNYIENLNNFYNENKDNYKIYSLRYGFKVFRHNGNLYKENKEVGYITPALGLAMFNGNIYRAGNHTKVRDKYNVYIDDENKYLLFSSEYTDSKRKFNINDSSEFNINDFFKLK